MRLGVRVLIASLAWLSLAEGKIGRVNSFATFSSQYSVYNDLQLGEGEANTLSESVDLEVAMKIYRSFYFSLISTHALDSTRDGFGLGGRVDLPGIFFFGADRGSFQQNSKKFPVNTSAYIQSLLVTNERTPGDRRRSVVSRYGLTLEIFLFSDVPYLIGDVSLYTLEGNSFVTYSAGLGFEF